MLSNFFKKYTGVFRRIKSLYWIANILHKKKLTHIKKAYKHYGINKPYYATVNSQTFEGLPNSLPWLDGEISEKLLNDKLEKSSFSNEIKSAIKGWNQNGYIHLKNFFSNDQIDSVNSEINNLITTNIVDFNYSGRKIMFAYQYSETLKKFAEDKKLKKVLSFILDKPVKLFSSINFLKGSEQKAHSDYIHMATYPDGNMIAAWVALEDVNLQNGTIFYYPGSHREPYVKNLDYLPNQGTLLIPKDANKRYENYIEEKVKKNNWEKKDFLAKKGDVLIWHANLIHGGNPILNDTSSRKSMVIHYFAEDVICYHETSQRPAYID